MNLITRLWKDEEGASAVEYGLLIALIATIIIAGVTTVGEEVSETFDEMGSSLAG